MRTGATTKLLTADEFYEFVHRPENDNRWFELVRGEVIELPPPRNPPGVVCVKIARYLDLYVDRYGKGYVAGNDSGVITEREPDTVRGPDVAYYDDADAFDELPPKYGEVPPKLAVEVLSPDDWASQVMRKITEYSKVGVAMVWIVDPEARTVTVHRPDKAQAVFDATQELTAEDLLPGFRCLVADFFRLAAERKKPPGAG